MKLIEEEGVIIKVPALPEKVSSDMPVFYNPQMKINRDVTLLTVKYLAKSLNRSLKIADPLAGTGVRSIRLLKNIENIELALINDIDANAFKNILENLEANNIEPSRYKVFLEEANVFLRTEGHFDYIDLDPFGSPVPFLESAIVSLSRKGIMGVTATDTAPLSGTYPETCIRRYGAKPLRKEFCHEVGIRILIYKVFITGASFDISMVPVFSYSFMHHFRVFFTKVKGAKITSKMLKENIGFIIYCHKCSYRSGVKDKCEIRYCPRCKNTLDYAGPLWIGKLWDHNLISFMKENVNSIKDNKKLKKILEYIEEEASIDVPFFYTLSSLSQITKKETVPPIKKVLEVMEGVRTHFSGEGFKTHLDFDEVIRRFVVL